MNQPRVIGKAYRKKRDEPRVRAIGHRDIGSHKVYGVRVSINHGASIAINLEKGTRISIFEMPDGSFSIMPDENGNVLGGTGGTMIANIGGIRCEGTVFASIVDGVAYFPAGTFTEKEHS